MNTPEYKSEAARLTAVKLDNRRNAAFFFAAIAGVILFKLMDGINVHEGLSNGLAVLSGLLLFAAFILIICPVGEFEFSVDCDCDYDSDEVEELKNKVKKLDDHNKELYIERDLLLQCNDERIRLFKFVEDARLKSLGDELQERARNHINTHTRLTNEIERATRGDINTVVA
jgi:hypothetical protein